MNPKTRRLSVGDALKKVAADFREEENDDEAEIAERRKTRVESAQKLGKKDVWNVPVTDMLAKEGQNENVDFRDASLTIDASAHVYSKRVEEVLTKTNTLAGGLASEDLESFAHLQDEEGGKLEEEEEIDAAAKEEVKAKKKRESKRGVNTLETNEATLTMKRNEREYAIDPLFHKRSAIFDSGGAKGLLLNVLSVHNGFQLIFDSADLVDDSEDPVAHVGGETESELRKLLTASLPTNWQDAEICPEFRDRVRSDGTTFEPQTIVLPDDDDYDDSSIRPQFAASSHMDIDDGPSDDFGAPASSSAANNNAMQEEDDELVVNFGGAASKSSVTDAPSASAWNYGPDGDDHDDDDQGGGGADFGGGAFLEAQLNRIEQQEQETDGMAQPDMEYYETTDGPNAEYTYFNRDKLANWSGPEHWKHKNIKTAKKGASAQIGDDDEYQDEEGNVIKAAKSKAARKNFRIDFNAPAPANLEELLTPAGAGTILPKTTLDKQLKDARMLMIPPDINYDVANFSATFLPHHVSVAMRRRAEAAAGGGSHVDDPWGAMDTGAGDYDHDDAPDAPFEFRGDVDMSLAAPSNIPGVALRPGDEGYLPNVAKIDKRVDVKALKQTIWKELCATTEGDSARSGVHIPANMQVEKPFQDVLEQLPLSMSEEVVREVSVPYCFVCLLHLANEKHLSIRQEDMTSLFITQTAPPVKA